VLRCGDTVVNTESLQHLINFKPTLKVAGKTQYCKFNSSDHPKPEMAVAYLGLLSS